MNLEEFANNGSGVNLEELYPPKNPVRPVNSATAMNESALTALLDPGTNPIETYKLLYDEALRGQDELAKQKYNNIVRSTKQSDRDIAINILADESLDESRKLSALKYLQSYEPSLAEAYMVKTAAADVKSHDAQASAVKETFHDYLYDELTYKEKQQAIVNTIAAEGLEGTTSEFAKSMGEFFIPGGMTVQAINSLQDIQKDLGIKPSLLSKLSQTAAKKEILSALNKLNPQERVEKLSKLSASIMQNSGVVFRNKNDLSAIQLLEELSKEGYTNTSAVADSLFQILDAIPVVGGVVKGTSKLFSLFRAAAKKPIAPLSPVGIATSSDPTMARGLYQAAAESPTDEAAMALAGTSKTDMILQVEGPKPLDVIVENGVPPSIADKVEEINSILKQGGYQFTDDELVRGKEELFAKFQQAHGATKFDTSTQVGVDGGDVVIKSVYGNGEGGFLSAKEALEKVQYQFRGFDIKQDSLYVMKKTPEGGYKKVDVIDDSLGDYKVGFEIRMPASPSSFDPFVSKYNWFDRFPFLRSKFTGSLARNLVDAASILPKNISGAAENAIDYSTRIDKFVIEIADDYSKRFKNLPSREQSIVEQVIKDQDANRVIYSDTHLRATHALSDEAIDALKVWRVAQDTDYYLSNLVGAKSLRNSGFMRLESPNASLYGKPIPKNAQLGRVYDAEQDVVRVFTQQEVDTLYNNGGSFAKLRSPETIQGQTITHFAVPNNPSNYLRVVRETDRVLNYIPGYYKRYYNSPRFVVQYGRDANGVKFERAVAVSGTWKEADSFLKSLASQAGVSPEDFGRVRSDIKQVIPGQAEEWDVFSHAGMVNQRHRGQLLTNTGNTPHIGGMDFVINPYESLIKNTSSVARRVALQDVVDNFKQRLLTEFKDLLPPDGSYPTSWQQIGKAGDMSDVRAKHARALWDYIDQLETGYYEAIDSTIKFTFNTLADSLGKMGYQKLERGSLLASRMNPMTTISSFVHEALIKWNPLRQWIVQPIQALQLYAYAPKAVVRATKDEGMLYWASAKRQFGKPLTKEETDILAFVERWGGFSGVDRQLMVDGPLRDLAKTTNVFAGSNNAILRGAGGALAMAGRGLGKASNAAGAVGFDAAEKLNLLKHLLTVRAKFVLEGKNPLDPRVFDEITSVTRALTLSMNEAGAMPYNKTTPALFMKFLQIPHKGLLKISTNRRLTTAEKLRIGALEAALYGVPIAAVGEWMDKDVLSEDPKTREIQQFGFLTKAYNQAFERIAGVNPKANLQSMGPYELDGWRKLVENYTEGGLNKMLASTPAGGLVVGANPRLTNAFQRLGAWANVTDYSKTPVEFVDVIKDFARISSGANNAINYYYVVQANRELNRFGAQIRDDVDNWTALHELFGIATTDEAASFSALKSARDIKKSKEDEVKAHIDFMLRVFRDRFNDPNNDKDKLMDLFAEVNRTFSDNPRMLDVAHKHLMERAKSTDTWFIDNILTYAGILSEDQIQSILKRSGVPEEQRRAYSELLSDMYNPEINKQLDEVFE